MVSRSRADIAFNDARQLLVCKRGQRGKKDKELDSKISLFFKKVKRNKKAIIQSVKKMFLFDKIDKNVQSSSLFLENS